ncbi:MAG: 4-hydroxy-tetrahydrodipicolinate synthase [Flavobacteriales bacterium]|nr:4-hydroxy-tetrahydrodipicolinate synthase [Flavobacteriales bacterium]
MESLHGVGVAMVTPFDKDFNVDMKGLEKLTEHLINDGADYLVVQGTTGESATLSAEEKTAVLDKMKEVNNGRLPIVLGIGGNNTTAVCKEIKSRDLDGISAILSASPYYNKPTQEGIYLHYEAISIASELPIILYNVPGRTASNITARTTLRLANDFDNIIGIKEASADMDQVMEIYNHKPDDFLLISGEDGLTFPIIACGGVGVISVVGNAFPGDFSKMVQLTKEGKLEEARAIHYRLIDFISLLFAEGNPGGIKSALKAMGICEDHMRLPLAPISKELEASIKQTVDGLLK